MSKTVAAPVTGFVFVAAFALSAGCGGSPGPAPPVETLPAGEFSYAPYARVLYEHVNEIGWVDYAGLQRDRADLDGFAALLAGLDPAELDTWSEADKIAFWINAYNALTLIAIIDHYPIEPSALRSVMYPRNSIRQIPGVWKKLQFTVLGKPTTLDAIEHEILRVEFDEPRIHMALVCAAISCPPLRDEPFRGARLEEQFDDQTVRFLADPDRFRIDRDRKRVYLSPIFDWFGDDFVSKYGGGERFPGRNDARRAVLEFVVPHLDDGDRALIEGNDFSIDFLDYDWTLNERRAR
ncbi:MAG: DUF547 domain-containing protein [Acidobacteriota bacterium]|nr:DUF547 domain-containing protein [Acidobacteriota bacterium]